MKPFSSLLLILLITIGCGPKKPADVSIVDSTATKAPAKPATTTATVEKVEKLDFNKSAIPASCNYVGKISDGAHWRDKNGDNYLLISQTEMQRPEKEGGALVQTIYGYCYAVTPDSAHLLWKIQDDANNPCDKAKGLVSDIRVVDLDNDGIAENAFIYNMQGGCDVSPTDYKLLMHSGSTKYAIRGSNRVKLGDTVLGGDKKIDFGSAPESYKAWASKLWDEAVK